MQPTKMDIFFSCSFAEADKKVNALFLAICRALGLQPTNVSTASIATPPEVAKDKIDSAQAVVAICTRRDELKGGGYLMPQAVHDEISFAYGKDTPVLMIVEDGVSIAGFKSNFGTYLSFVRGKLNSPDFLEKAIEAIHNLRAELLGPADMGATYGMHEAHAEYVRHMVELRAADDDFIWQYSTTKKLVYTHASKRGIPSSFWTTSTSQVPENAPNLPWEIVLENSSRGIRLEPKILKHTPACVDAIIKLIPSPDEGDFIEYSTVAASRYLNPIWADEAPSEALVHLGSGDYQCADGLVFLHRTKTSVIEFRFAREYGIERSEVVPFVGSYTSTIDFEVESELKRTRLKFEHFGGILVVRMEIDSPLPGHLYGIAWNPKPRPAGDPEVEASSET